MKWTSEKCWLDTEHKQCCCQCRYHLADHFHCGHLTWQEQQNMVGMPREKHKSVLTDKEVDSCVCSVQRGWICAPPDFDGTASSNWPEHSVGCEMYAPVKKVKS